MPREGVSNSAGAPEPMEERTMRRSLTPPPGLDGRSGPLPSGPAALLLPALLALVLLAPAVVPAADAPAPVPGRSGGHVEPAPAAAYDTLRHQADGPARAAYAAPAAEAVQAAPPPLPLLLDTNDFGFGTSVVFGRMPSPKDIADLSYLSAVRHIVIALSEWPAGYEELLPLGQTLLPEGADLVVILPGYPPTHAAAEAWNYLRLPLRIVLVVDGPPGNRAGIDELNRIRGLERVIADMEEPTRSGFERLQRPLSFRIVKR